MEIYDLFLSIVIPCYNSAGFLKKTINEIEEALGDVRHEIILVNDASLDDTYDVIRCIASEHSNIIGIDLAKNFGQHAALMAGFSKTSGNAVLCMDDDGQTPASEIQKLLEALNDDVDVVYARYESKNHSTFRNLGSKMNAKMTEWMLGKPKELYVSSFFLARKFVIDEVLKYRQSFPYVIGLILRSTNKIVNVTVEHKKREQGQSGYSMKKLIALWMNGFTAFSIFPLRIADLLGATIALIGFITAVILIIKRLIIGYSIVQGWYSLISVILIVGGLLMLVLGLTGEYIGRTYMCISQAPQYVIRKSTDHIDKDYM